MTFPSDPPRLLLCCPSCGVRIADLEAELENARLLIDFAHNDLAIWQQRARAAEAVCDRLTKERDNGQA